MINSFAWVHIKGDFSPYSKRGAFACKASVTNKQNGKKMGGRKQTLIDHAPQNLESGSEVEVYAAVSAIRVLVLDMKRRSENPVFLTIVTDNEKVKKALSFGARLRRENPRVWKLQTWLTRFSQKHGFKYRIIMNAQNRSDDEKFAELSRFSQIKMESYEGTKQASGNA